jgi:hypothetical protein
MSSDVDTFQHLLSRELVACNAFEWLWWLKSEGVRRLSAGSLEKLPPVKSVEWDRMAVLCHFKDRVDVWAMGHVRSLAMRKYDEQKNLESWFGQSLLLADTYLHVSTVSVPNSEKALPVNWQKLHHDMQAELNEFDSFGFNRSRHAADSKWYFAQRQSPDDQQIKPLPTLPADKNMAQAHAMLIQLDGLESAFFHATHPKDEGNLYFTLGRAGLDRLDAFSETITSWTERVQSLCASYTGWQPEFLDAW